MEIKRANGICGEITVAPDKSISHRGVMLGAISNGITEIDNFLMGEDCLSTISCFRKMGIEIEMSGKRVIVHGKGMRGLSKPNELLYTGNSGTTTRLLCGLLAPQNFTCVIDGDESIRKRPMSRVINPLKMMGADITSNNDGYTPLTIKGKNLKGINYEMPVASAQLKSALILAGLYAEGKTTIKELEPSRNHSEIMINGFGGNINTCSESGIITVNPACELFGQKVLVPGDISSAAFFIVGALIVPGSELVIKNVGLNHTRTGIIDVLKAMGADIQIEDYNDDIEPSGTLIVKSSRLKGIEIGGELIPRLIDEIPIIAVAAAFAEGATVIKDAKELKVKESNRIDAMKNELTKANVDVEATEDGLIINGGKLVKGATFDSYNDHRIAMSMAILAMASEGSSFINNHECIGISYPDFFETINKVTKS